MTTSLVSARWIVTGIEDNGEALVIPNAALAHDNGRVVAVGPADQIRTTYEGAAET